MRMACMRGTGTSGESIDLTHVFAVNACARQCQLVRCLRRAYSVSHTNTGYEMSVCECGLPMSPLMSFTEDSLERLTAPPDSLMQAFGEALQDAIRERENCMRITWETEEYDAQYAHDLREWDF